MAGLYIHVPFCKQACHYCNFHFSTNLNHQETMVEALMEEIRQRSQFLHNQTLETIYFGGGTPSLLTADQLTSIFAVIHDHFDLSVAAEVTLEANPDDLTRGTLECLYATPINRLSIGIQSFDQDELQLMNRAHDAEQAHLCLETAGSVGFDNVSIDLIFGLPAPSSDRWMSNVLQAIEYAPRHMSCYGLTVEPKTALAYRVKKGTVKMPTEDVYLTQFYGLIEQMGASGFDHYEISNFAIPGWEARHNTNYWRGIPYLGIGPSAHSFDGDNRSWNIANNHKYLKAQRENQPMRQVETLTLDQKYNEYVMVSLRTKWGCSINRVAQFGVEHMDHFLQSIEQPIADGMINKSDGKVMLTHRGKAFADRLASDLFKV